MSPLWISPPRHGPSGQRGWSLQLEGLPALVQVVLSNDQNVQLEATTQFRKLLSIECSPPIEEIISIGVVPRFIEFLTCEDHPQLQFEAAWALTKTPT
ncbi:unnamed protein product [Urochloa humidicola]